MIYDYTCPQCNKPFTRENKNSHFCSRQCANTANKKKLFDKPCKVCGKVFSPNSEKSKYCSDGCYNATRPLRIQICVICNNEFTDKTHNKKTCSATCNTKQRNWLVDIPCKYCKKYFRPQRDGLLHCSMKCVGMSQRTLPDYTCLNCNKIFRTKNENPYCCSRKCRTEYINYTGKGLSRRGFLFSSITKYEIYILDNGRCRFCKSENGLQFDHITAICNADGLESDFLKSSKNCQLICEKCHKKKTILDVKTFWQSKRNNTASTTV